MFVTDPSDVNPDDVHWLAGLLEGEGSFMPGPPSRPHMPVISVQMTDEDVIRRAANLLGRRPQRVEPQRARWTATWHLRLTGHRAAAWMRHLHPLMGARRRAQIDRALATYAPRDSAKLSDDDARAALDLLSGGIAVADVAERYGVTVWCIYDLRIGRTHKHLQRGAALAPRRRVGA